MLGQRYLVRTKAGDHVANSEDEVLTWLKDGHCECGDPVYSERDQKWKFVSDLEKIAPLFVEKPKSKREKPVITVYRLGKGKSLQDGPFTLSAVLEMIKLGTLGSNSWIFVEGDSEWRQVKAVKILRQALPKLPESPPTFSTESQSSAGVTNGSGISTVPADLILGEVDPLGDDQPTPPHGTKVPENQATSKILGFQEAERESTSFVPIPHTDPEINAIPNPVDLPTGVIDPGPTKTLVESKEKIQNSVESANVTESPLPPSEENSAIPGVPSFAPIPHDQGSIETRPHSMEEGPGSDAKNGLSQNFESEGPITGEDLATAIENAKPPDLAVPAAEVPSNEILGNVPPSGNIPNVDISEDNVPPPPVAPVSLDPPGFDSSPELSSGPPPSVDLDASGATDSADNFSAKDFMPDPAASKAAYEEAMAEDGEISVRLDNTGINFKIPEEELSETSEDDGPIVPESPVNMADGISPPPPPKIVESLANESVLEGVEELPREEQTMAMSVLGLGLAATEDKVAELGPNNPGLKLAEPPSEAGTPSPQSSPPPPPGGGGGSNAPSSVGETVESSGEKKTEDFDGITVEISGEAIWQVKQENSGRVTGPFTFQEILDMLQTGRLNQDDKISKAGSGRFNKISQQYEFNVKHTVETVIENGVERQKILIKRRHPRVAYITDAQIISHGKTYHAKCVNISAGGVLIEATDLEIDLGDQIELNLMPGMISSNIQTTALVIGKIPKKPPGFALKFVNLSIEDKESIQFYVMEFLKREQAMGM